MFCAISGEAPKEPLISKNGHVFEKRLIEKHLAEEGKCPVTGEDMELGDLIAVKVNKAVHPRPIQATSVPGLLALFQNEWDSLMLETFTLKKHLDSVRQELSQALYQHDAACRVIARLVKDRDSLRGELQRYTQAAGSNPPAAAAAAAAATDTMEVDAPDGSALPAKTIAELKKVSASLSGGRKKRPKPQGLPKKEKMSSLSEKSSYTPHASRSGGITCIDMQAQKSRAVTGGMDKAVKVTDLTSGDVVSTKGAGHSKKVTCVKFHPSKDLFFSCSADKTVRYWAPAGGSYKASYVSKDHSASVTNITVHPTGDYLVSASDDNSWMFHDLDTQKVVLTCDDSSTKGVKCVQFHPDCLILGAGTGGGEIRIFDMKNSETKAVATFAENDGACINCISFSENGYYMSSGASDGMVKLWDLRKLKAIKDFKANGAVSCINFDHSGSYLAAAANDIDVRHVKSWAGLATLSAHSKQVTGLKFSHNATSIASVSMDKTLKLFGIA